MNLNRIFILILLLVLTFGLYKYQQFQLIENTPPTKVESTFKVQRLPINTPDDVTVDNVSQVSLGSLEDLRSINESTMQSLNTDF